MSNTNKAARFAGAIYLSLVLSGPPYLPVLPNSLGVRGNATAAANNLLNHEGVARLWIILDRGRLSFSSRGHES